MYNRRLAFTLISILISLFILGIVLGVLIRVYPVISSLSEKSKSSVSVSLIAEKIFATIEEMYTNKDIPLPESFSGQFPDFPGYYYNVNFIEEKEDLYRVELEIKWKRQGNDESKIFVSEIRRR